MKKILLLIFMLFTFNTTYAFVLNGGVSYTVDEVRQYLFSDAPLKIDMQDYKSFMIDSNYSKNKELIKKNKFKYKGRYITSFWNGSYAISYKRNLFLAYYYNEKGELIALDINDAKYPPIKSYQYDVNGNLKNLAYYPTNDEVFIFDVNKTLVSHWIGKNGYNEKGEFFGIRD